jgi:hypothetical protein
MKSTGKGQVTKEDPSARREHRKKQQQETETTSFSFFFYYEQKLDEEQSAGRSPAEIGRGPVPPANSRRHKPIPAGRDLFWP